MDGTPQKLKTNDPRLNAEPTTFLPMRLPGNFRRAAKYYRLDGAGAIQGCPAPRLKEHLAARHSEVAFRFPALSVVGAGQQERQDSVSHNQRKTDWQSRRSCRRLRRYDEDQERRPWRDRNHRRSPDAEFLGETWGEKGYGWLPYVYVLEGGATSGFC